MIIADSCMIWFDFDYMMQLKKSYHIATNVCSRKSATTFGDLPDCLFWSTLLYINVMYVYKDCMHRTGNSHDFLWYGLGLLFIILMQ